MKDTVETVGVRIVRCVQGVHPRALSSTDIANAIDGVQAPTLMGELSRVSQSDMPLEKKRGDDGRLQYTLRPGFDIDAWIAARKTARPRRDSPAGGIDEGISIVQVLRLSANHLTANQIYDAGDFTTRPGMLLELTKLCEPGGPLERDRTGNGAPFLYWIRTDFDVAGWIAERGGEPSKQTESAAEQGGPDKGRGAGSLEHSDADNPLALAAAPATEPATAPAAAKAAPSQEGAVPAGAGGPKARPVPGRDTADTPRSLEVPRFNKPAARAIATALPTSGRCAPVPPAAAPASPAQPATTEKPRAAAPPVAASDPKAEPRSEPAPAPRTAAVILSELRASTLDELLAIAVECSDPQIAALGRKLVKIDDLAEEFERVPV